jgi:CrcB protein
VITVVAVGAGGLIGAPARFVVDQAVNSHTRGIFPWGTYVINATGALLLGLISGLVAYHGLAHAVSALVGVGFCGAYTTFSTFSWETVRLLEDGTPSAAMRNVAASLAAGLLAAAAGMGLAYVA